MKIVSWNCNGALRKKLPQLLELDADIYVIQECEDPARTNDKNYANWAKNYLWLGNSKNKGLGIFCKEGILLEKISLDAGRLESFLPCLINKSLMLLGVWTREANSPTFRYIGQMWKYWQEHKDIFRSNKTIVIGDFNSNTCWDVWDRWWNHSDVVKDFEEVGIVSLYHLQTGLKQGEEKSPTFYMYRKLDRPYHIDYVFLSHAMSEHSTMNIGAVEEWIPHSDHMPLLVNINTVL